jgi:hypothetical protein
MVISVPTTTGLYFVASLITNNVVCHYDFEIRNAGRLTYINPVGADVLHPSTYEN